MNHFYTAGISKGTLCNRSLRVHPVVEHIDAVTEAQHRYTLGQTGTITKLMEDILNDIRLYRIKHRIAKAKQIAKIKGLNPGKVKGTEGVQFTKGTNGRLDVISWDEFEAILKKRNLAVYESGGWMKIMNA